MLRYSLRRFYFALIGVLLFTLPLFATMRFQMHDKNICEWWECDGGLRPYPSLLLRNGPFYPVWQTGTPPYDYWPLALALLAAAGAVDLVAVLRSRSRLA